MTTQPWTVSDLQGSPRRQRRETAIRRLVFAATVTSVLVSGLILYSLAFEAITFMREVDWSTTWGQLGWFPRRGIFDLPTIMVATVSVTVIAMAVAGPLGLAAAIYLSEYAPSRVRTVLKPTLEVMAGIPSVVLGYFALRFIAPQLVGNLFSTAAPANLLAAGVGVGLLIIPLMASLSEDALTAVPHSLRQASAGLGARKVTTTTNVVIPAAVSGLTAAGIVAASRAVGETMVVFIAGGAADSVIKSYNPLDPGMTMTAAMASVASGTDSIAGQGQAFQSLFFVGLLLFIMTMLLNVLADKFVRRFRQRY